MGIPEATVANQLFNHKQLKNFQKQVDAGMLTSMIGGLFAGTGFLIQTQEKP